MTEIVRVRILSEPCTACGAAPGERCRASIGGALVPVVWTHTRGPEPPDRFAHVDAAAKQAAVDGFVRVNPHHRGIHFEDMMEMILDSDSHLPIVGDVRVEGDAATKLVLHLAALRGRT